MVIHNTRWIIAVCWVSLVLLTFWILDVSSGIGFVLLAISALVPPAVMLVLSNNGGPQQTIAEVLYDTEMKR